MQEGPLTCWLDASLPQSRGKLEKLPTGLKLWIRAPDTGFYLMDVVYHIVGYFLPWLLPLGNSGLVLQSISSQ